MGRIACCNVLSDLYAMGVTECDNMLMLLGMSTAMKEEEKKVATQLIMEGFRDCAVEAGTSIQGGQTVMNPWMIIGGVATSVCLSNELIMPDRGVLGDVLVLTKPLGTQVAVNLHQWMVERTPRWEQLKELVTADEVEQIYHAATVQMARLNRTASRLMHKYGAHGCTDVTGFGLLGHADNLGRAQTDDQLSLVIHNLPCIRGTAMVSRALGGMFGLLAGTSAETSGGLLILMPREAAAAYCHELEQLEGYPAWIIGLTERTAARKGARIVDKPRVLEIEWTTSCGDASQPATASSDEHSVE